jgi:aromatase
MRQEAHTDHAVVIAAPYERVWEMTNDLERWPTLFSEYSSVEILERRGRTVRFRLTMHPDAQGNCWSWISERTPNPDTGTVLAHRVETGWFVHMHIRWDYERVRGGVLLRWRQAFAMRQDSPVSLEEMHQRIDAGSPVQMSRIKAAIEQHAPV